MARDNLDAKALAKENSRSRKDSQRSRNASSSDKSCKMVLTSLSQPQMVSVLDRFQLVLKSGFSNEDFTKLLSCNKVFMGYFDQYNMDQIMAIFDKYGNCTDFETLDGKIKEIFWEYSSGKLYPCCVCSDEITKEGDHDADKQGVQHPA